MRPRFVVLASLIAALGLAVLPAVGNAAPKHNHGLTINATPDPIVTGDQVMIYGQLNTDHPGNRLIVLYHRVNPATQFSVVGTTRTNATGFYEFLRADGVVTTNRNWFVTGPGTTHSRTVHEHVAASVGLTASTTTGDTNHAIVFSGHVSPNHAGERVYLQLQQGFSGDDWGTLKSGRLGPGSNYSISYRFKDPGERDLRVLLPGDARNITSTSDDLTVSVQQTQNPSFTINAAPQNIDEGSTATISGVLYKAGSTTTPDGGVGVTLWGHAYGKPYIPLQFGTTNSTTGGYSFTVMPSQNIAYQVRTTPAPPRSTAQVFVGVRDVVSITPSSTSSTVGGTITFIGGVIPDKAGHAIYLQRLGADHDWHTVKTTFVTAGSTYTFSWRFGTPGTKVFRVLVPGGPYNISGHSASESIAVALPAVQLLPPGS
jgi:hypothetical protein